MVPDPISSHVAISPANKLDVKIHGLVVESQAVLPYGCHKSATRGYQI
jgi:hypothetical protein